MSPRNRCGDLSRLGLVYSSKRIDVKMDIRSVQVSDIIRSVKKPEFRQYQWGQRDRIVKHDKLDDKLVLRVIALMLLVHVADRPSNY